MTGKSKSRKKSSPRTDWDPLADWYDGWVGGEGSKHHQKLAIPAILDLLELKMGDRLLDLGAGQGVLCPYVVAANAEYTGVDLSERLIQIAKTRHGTQGRFFHADVLTLPGNQLLAGQKYDAVTFLLSLQDMDPLDGAIASARHFIKTGGIVVILMTHPCFRVPRQSGWGWDEKRKLRFRRIDSYLSKLTVPLKQYPGARKGVSRSFHRPLNEYLNTLSEHQLFVERLIEIPTYKEERAHEYTRAINRSNREIPLFLGLRARNFPSGG